MLLELLQTDLIGPKFRGVSVERAVVVGLPEQRLD